MGRIRSIVATPEGNKVHNSRQPRDSYDKFHQVHLKLRICRNCDRLNSVSALKSLPDERSVSLTPQTYQRSI